MRIDRAYCEQTDSVLTIYQVRDLHFDVNEEFFSKRCNYSCPDEDCSALLVGVNDESVEFKVTPHFRTKKGEEHSDECEYVENTKKKSLSESINTKNQRAYKVSDIPEVFLLERQKPPFGTGKVKKKRKRDQVSGPDDNAKQPQNKNISPHETSCLEHIVEVWESRDEKELRDRTLTISGKTRYYRNVFKKVHFLYDGIGFIYFGKVKDIKEYKTGYAIRFYSKSPYPQKSEKKYPISIFIQHDLIESYRRRKQFRQHIQILSDMEDEDITCYFIGGSPKLKDVQSAKAEFKALNVEVSNLDHLVLRHHQGGEL